MWPRESWQRMENFTSSQRGSTERRGRGVELTRRSRGDAVSWRGSAHAAKTSPSTGTGTTFSTGEHQHHRSPGRHKDTPGNLSTTSRLSGGSQWNPRFREKDKPRARGCNRRIYADSEVRRHSGRFRWEQPESKGNGGGDFSRGSTRGRRGGGDAVNWLGRGPTKPGRSSLTKYGLGLVRLSGCFCKTPIWNIFKNKIKNRTLNHVETL
jgi:hypothetical protein